MAGARARAARRGLIALTVVLLVIVALAAGASKLWNAARSAVAGPQCTISSYTLDPDQAQIASEIVGVVTTRRLPERAAVLTLGAALQESKLRNIPSGQGDRDSVGILQQRPSQGWGTAAQISDVRYATGKFLDAVVKVDNWQQDTLANVVQTVQFSADGQAYAKHEAQAQAIADALTGVTPAGVNCSFGKASQVAPVSEVVAKLRRDLPVAAPQTTATTVSVPGAGWTTAAWFVCNADALGIDRVAFSGREWNRANGWKARSSAGSAAVTARLGQA